MTAAEIEQRIEAKRREWRERPERQWIIERFEIPPLRSALREALKKQHEAA